ncbi:DAN domain family member 5 [Girardinichthys multiradiatus]|uniref:DAN domain family member 5 n=1 Tax=Girardinichthys multiradiatus TaxID=208333 RepID=UPI001FAE007E|nr:DAN domain family member 5 [Girardinichthys multiradiatus]
MCFSQTMASLISLIILSTWTTSALMFPFNSFLRDSRDRFESSGGEADQAVQEIVKVVQLDSRNLVSSGLFRRGHAHRGVPSHTSRLPFPAFLSQGRPGPAAAPKDTVSPLHLLHPKRPTEIDMKSKQGLQMWQKVMDKGGKVSLPVNLKDTKQTCTAVPFTQHVTADGCQTVIVHNKLCFGQCSSLFVPSEGEFADLSPGTGAFHRQAPCSRCAPFKAQTVTVPLRCGAQVLEKRVMVVEECKCETGREEKSAEAAAYTHL